MPQVTIYPNPISVNASDTVVLTCIGRGIPTPQVTWDTSSLKSETQIRMQAQGTKYNNRSTTEISIITIHDISPEDHTVLRCRAKNIVGYSDAQVPVSVSCKYFYNIHFHLSNILLIIIEHN